MLRRIDPELGMARFYSLMIERDLLGIVRLVRHWGRIGAMRGRELAQDGAANIRIAKSRKEDMIMPAKVLWTSYLASSMVLSSLLSISAEAKTMMIPDDLKVAIAQHHVAFNAFLKGEPRLWKEHCSQRDDVTIIGAWGGFEKGWAAQVEKRYEWAAARFKGTEGDATFENISLVVTPELAYSVDIERARVRLAGRDDFVPMVLRSTTIYRFENGTWRMTHRHADPLIDIQGVDSVRK